MPKELGCSEGGAAEAFSLDGNLQPKGKSQEKKVSRKGQHKVADDVDGSNPQHVAKGSLVVIWGSGRNPSLHGSLQRMDPTRVD